MTCDDDATNELCFASSCFDGAFKSMKACWILRVNLRTQLLTFFTRRRILLTANMLRCAKETKASWCNMRWLETFWSLVAKDVAVALMDTQGAWDARMSKDGSLFKGNSDTGRSCLLFSLFRLFSIRFFWVVCVAGLKWLRGSKHGSQKGLFFWHQYVGVMWCDWHDKAPQEQSATIFGLTTLLASRLIYNVPQFANWVRLVHSEMPNSIVLSVRWFTGKLTICHGIQNPG